MGQIQHLIKATQLSLEDINEWLQKAESFEKKLKEEPEKLNELERIVVGSIFCEESTRTRFCLERAAHNLRASVIGTENAAIFSAMAPGKEESLEDTIKVISGFQSHHLRLVDIIILRHPEIGAAEKAAKVSGVPLINAGDGKYHPTQTLTDLLAFLKFLGRLNDLTVAFVGDLLNSRIIEEDVILFSYFPGFRPIFVSPPGLGIEERLRSFLVQRGIKFDETDDIREVICDCDAGYIVRVQKNRIKDPEQLSVYQKNRDNVAVTQEVYDMTEKRGTLFFHPMPVSSVEKEIRPEVVDLLRVKMYQQANLKVLIGMVALTELWRTYKATH